MQNFWSILTNFCFHHFSICCISLKFHTSSFKPRCLYQWRDSFSRKNPDWMTERWYDRSLYIYIYIYIGSKVGDHSRGRPEGFLFESYDTEVKKRALLLSLVCSTLPLIRTVSCWVLSEELSSTIFKVFGMTQTGIEPMSPWPLANTLPTKPMSFSPVIKFY